MWLVRSCFLEPLQYFPSPLVFSILALSLPCMALPITLKYISRPDLLVKLQAPTFTLESKRCPAGVLMQTLHFPSTPVPIDSSHLLVA